MKLFEKKKNDRIMDNIEVGCEKPLDPLNGLVLCNSRVLKEGSKCILECSLGYIPAQAIILYLHHMESRKKKFFFHEWNGL